MWCFVSVLLKIVKTSRYLLAVKTSNLRFFAVKGRVLGSHHKKLNDATSLSGKQFNKKI